MPNKPGLVAGVISALLVGGLTLLVHSAAGETFDRLAIREPWRRHRRRPDASRDSEGATGTAEVGTRSVRHLRPDQDDAFLGGSDRPA